MRESYQGDIKKFQVYMHLTGFPCGSAGKESACNGGSLDWKDPLEKGKASHSSILALDCKEIQPVHPKGDQSWVFIGRTDWSWNSNTLATWCKELTHWKRPWCWERVKTGGEEDNRGWDGWMASPTWWTWIWVSSGSWWWTGKPGVLLSMGVTKSQTWRSYWNKLITYNML